MKQSLKYGLLIVLALLLHSVTMKAVAFVDLSTEAVQEECFLSQAHPMQHAFNRFYIYYSNMPCEMGHVDMSHIPTDKSFIRHFTRFREHKAMNDSFFDYLVHPLTYSSSDPVSYYVFGLRKIIV